MGGNFRLDAIQAAIVTVKLQYLDGWTAGRQCNAKKYDQLFAQAGISAVLPFVSTTRHIFNQYVIRLSQRDALRAHLKKAGIETEIYYPVPLHLQECFDYLGNKEGAFPESERAAEETIALPVFPELTERQIADVVHCIREFTTGTSGSGAVVRAERI